MIEELTYRTFSLKRDRLKDAEKEVSDARSDLRRAEDTARRWGLNPYRASQIEFEEARRKYKQRSSSRASTPGASQ